MNKCCIQNVSQTFYGIACKHIRHIYVVTSETLNQNASQFFLKILVFTFSYEKTPFCSVISEMFEEKNGKILQYVLICDIRCFVT